MNTRTHAGYRLSRRTFVASAVAGGMVAGLPLGGRVMARQDAAIAAPLDEQLTWLLEMSNGGVESLTAEDVTAHFTPDFLTIISPEVIISLIQQINAAFSPLTLEGFTRPPTATQANAYLMSGAGIPVIVPVSIEAASPNRITGMNAAPVPPPPEVQLAPVVNPAGTPVADSGRRDGLIDIGGRELYFSFHGSGGPTVVLESGANDPAAPWFNVESAVASFAQVFSYDRANTSGGASDPAPKPRTAADAVADLHALLEAAEVPAPYVLVGHSIGGPFVRLFATTYPDEVAGLVLVDSSHEEQNNRLRTLVSADQWEAFEQMIFSIEGLDLDAIFTQVKEAQAANPLQPMPLAVLSAGKRADPATLPPDWPSEAQAALWAELQEDLAGLVPDSHHVIAEQSEHYIHQSQPDLVVEAIRSVVMAAQDPDTWATPAVATPVR